MLDSCGAAGVARTWLTLRWLPALFDDIAQHTMPSQAPASPRRRAAVLRWTFKPGAADLPRPVAASWREASPRPPWKPRTRPAVALVRLAASPAARRTVRRRPPERLRPRLPIRYATPPQQAIRASRGQAFQPVLHGQAHAQRQVADKAQGAPCGAPGPVRQRSAQPAAHRGCRHSTDSRRGTTSRAQSASRVDPAPLPARPG